MAAKDIALIQNCVTSLDLAVFTGKRHSTILRDIKDMSSSWLEVTGQEFVLSEYTDLTGRTLPMYRLKKAETYFIVSRYNHKLRAMIIIRLEQLENERMRLEQQQYRRLKTENDRLWDASDRDDLYRRR